MTATLPQPSTTAAPDVPNFITIDIPQAVWGDARSIVAALYADATANHKAEQELHAERGELLAGLKTKTVAQVEAAATELNARRRSLETERCELRWQRAFEVLPKLIPVFEQGVADADLEYERLCGEVREHLASQGVTALSMPAGHANHPAAERQLFQKIREHEAVLSAIADQRRMKAATQGLLPQIYQPVALGTCQIKWHSVPTGIVGVIATAIGLGPATPCLTVPSLSSASVYVARECGLENTPLLAEHVEVINQIAAALPVQHRPLRAATGKALERARKLLQHLPATREIQDYLQATADGPIKLNRF